MNPIDQFVRACANTGRLVKGVRPEQWTMPTPCDEWDVRALVNHTTYAMHVMNAALEGTARPAPDTDYLGTDPGASFTAAANKATAGFRALPSLDPPVEMPIGEVPAGMALSIATLDVYTHAWDIAQATGQDAGFDDQTSAAVLAFAQQALPGVEREGRFGPEVTITDDAPVGDRMLAYLGRKP